MGEGEEHVVVHLGAGPAAVDLGVHLLDRSEQHERLIDQVAPEVVQHPAGLLAVAALAPGTRAHLGPPALEARLEAPHLAQAVFGEQPAHGEEVAVPAPVVEDRQRQAALLGERRQTTPLRGAGGQRLVDHHREAGLQRRRGQRDV